VTAALSKATATIPIVFAGLSDPIGDGIVASLARPAGNITGNTILSPDLSAKRLQILREAIPNAARVAFLTNADNASNMATFAEMRVAASAAGIALTNGELEQIQVDLTHSLHA
jgi:putative ABC transport system substrate-binding protein